MKFNNIQRFSLTILFLFVSILVSSGQNVQNKKQNFKTKPKQSNTKYKVTFIELGSVRCIPCQKMQPIMASIKEKYANQVNVIFYDVWTPLGKPMAFKYNVQVIPTQVFLDENDIEFYRHEGYFPEEELIKVLKSKGVK
jgi:thioredoxin 1